MPFLFERERESDKKLNLDLDLDPRFSLLEGKGKNNLHTEERDTPIRIRFPFFCSFRKKGGEG